MAALVAALLALPALIGAWPARDATVGAAELRDRALASEQLRFSGVVESAGGLLLPVGRRALSPVVDLLSDRTRMRVWWRGPEDHRVDVLGAGGETGYRRDPAGTWVWEYEDARATRSAAAPLALPTPPDLLPSSLGRRLLSEASEAELSRIGAQRVSGRAALGLRITPGPPSSVERADVWVDEATGLPIRVQVVGGAAGRTALDTRFLDLDPVAPDPATTAFVPPPGATAVRDRTADVLEEAGYRIAPVALPAELAGLPRRTLDGAPPAVGLYGRGVTLLAVVPVSGRVAGDLVRGLRADPDVVEDGSGVRAAAGPLGVALFQRPDGTVLLATGTVTLDALATAAVELGAARR